MNLIELNNSLADKSAVDCMRIVSSAFHGKLVFTTSFGLEDQIITHLIFMNNIPIEVVTLDTGRLFPETYKVFNETIKKYQKNIRVYFPDKVEVEKMVTKKGPFSFYYSKENRIECCYHRKVMPLNRALSETACWISGIRADHSENRSQMKKLEFDEIRKLYKLYPLFDWSYDEVISFVRENNIPYNVLHDKGFVSIGCEPCTRAIKAGEEFRAGRWWWENGGKKECGLHAK
jgi:phosphoadenosine phosphosulfate reductase